MSSRLRSAVQAVVGAVLVGLVVAWLSGTCGRKIAPGEIEPTATPGAGGRVAVVERLLEPVVEQVSGTLASARHTTVSSKILARIEEIKVRAGSQVGVGDVLIVLDARDLDARARESQEARVAARSQLDLARRERDRLRELFAKGVAPKRDYDRVMSAYEVAAAEVERAEQRVRDAEVGLSHAEIRSPVAGRVVDRLAEPGDNAAPGAPLLRIYDPSVLRLEAPVRESLAQHLVVGQRVHVLLGASSGKIDGEVEEIVPQAEPGARTFLVKVRFPPQPGVFSGMFGRIEVPAGERERLRVPASAVDRIGQLEFMTVVSEEGRPGRRLVTTGALDEAGDVEVLSGLAAGERVGIGAPRGD